MKADRMFYSVAGALFLLMMLVGFHSFAHGQGQGGRIIDPSIFSVVAVHGLAIAAWYVLFFVQSLLITFRQRKLHMTLGWAAIAIGLTIAVTGSLVAIRSVQVTPPQFEFFGLLYSRFLLVMLTEIALFTVFVAVGIAVRKQPKKHRPMMLLASLTLLSGATVRMPFLYPVFGNSGWVSMFGAVFLLGAVLMLVRYAMTRSVEPWFVAGYAVWVIAYLAAENLALTHAWSQMAAVILKL